MSLDLRQLRTIARGFRRAGGDRDTTERARLLAAYAVASYRECTLPGAARRFPTLLADTDIVSQDEQAISRGVGTALAGQRKPLAAYLLSTFYTLLLPEDVRSERGVYFTPPALTERLLDLLENAGVHWEDPTVLDPAAGGGAFLAPVAVRMAATLTLLGATPNEILGHVSTHLKGIELDPFSSWMATVFLETTLSDFCEVYEGALDTVITSGDALKPGNVAESSFDVVVGNPPYGRVTLPPDVREAFSRSLYGHANLYGLFTDLAVRATRPGGVIGYVTPSSFLGGQYFKNLRSLLAGHAPPLAIDFVVDRAGVFDKVLQETVLVVLARDGQPSPVEVSAVQPSELVSLSVVQAGAFTLPLDPESPWALPRTRDDALLLASALRSPYRLRDYGLVVSTGPLVWNRHRAQLKGQKEPGTLPLVWAESVTPAGTFRFSAKRRNHAPYFRVREGEDHLVTRREAVLVQRTTAKEQQRRLNAAVLDRNFIEREGGAVVENHLNLVHAPDGRAKVSLRAVATLLNSRVLDTIFRCISGSVAVSAFELESLPMPPVTAMEELEAMLVGGSGAEKIEEFIESVYHARRLGVAA